MTHLNKIHWCAMVPRIGWYAARQAMLRRGASMADVAWVLVSRLKIEGAK